VTEQPYTEADIELCIEALGKSWDEGRDTDDGFVRACLDALAAAGRLLPEGASPYADGYAAAVAALRNDNLYHNWWSALDRDDPEWGYWKRTPRRELADFLEVVAPAHINEESTE
jgi:hypothetical protein